jgi:fluoroquinolone transport system ATP-binding protein
MAAGPMVAVGRLSFTYPQGAGPAVDGVSFSIDRGEIFGFLGPNGAGKSTTQNILIGLLRGYRGQISVLGRDLASWGADYYEHIGVSFELPNHYKKLTARENLQFFRSLYSVPTRTPDELLELIDLSAQADTRVARLSKGMQVRLTFARALLNRPELLFLDEPTMGLDPLSASRIRGIIRRQREDGCTVFLTTHNMMAADELCDRVAFIVDGRIVLVDSPRELKIKHGRKSVRVEHRHGGDLTAEQFPLRGLGENERFLSLLKAGTVETMHSQEATLEDIFIAVTGKRLD